MASKTVSLSVASSKVPAITTRTPGSSWNPIPPGLIAPSCRVTVYWVSWQEERCCIIEHIELAGDLPCWWYQQLRLVSDVWSFTMNNSAWELMLSHWSIIVVGKMSSFNALWVPKQSTFRGGTYTRLNAVILETLSAGWKYRKLNAHCSQWVSDTVWHCCS